VGPIKLWRCIALAALGIAVVASTLSALPARGGAPRLPLGRVLRAPVRWQGAASDHVRKAEVVLGNDHVVLIRRSTTTATGATSRTARIATSGFGDGSGDSLISYDGRTVTETDLPAGALARAGGSGPCPRSVTCRRLGYRWTRCLQIDDGYSYAYQCFHVYAAATSSARLGYHVGWWTGTANSDRGSDLTSVVDRDDLTGCSACGVQLDEWSPNGDTHPPGSGRTINLGFGLSGMGVNASIGESLTVFAQVFGPAAGSPTRGAFRFLWAGKVGAGSSIGMAGGDEWQYRRAYGYPWLISITNRVCYPSWLC
jgi:hypothetical protein